MVARRCSLQRDRCLFLEVSSAHCNFALQNQYGQVGVINTNLPIHFNAAVFRLCSVASNSRLVVVSQILYNSSFSFFVSFVCVTKRDSFFISRTKQRGMIRNFPARFNTSTVELWVRTQNGNGDLQAYSAQN